MPLVHEEATASSRWRVCSQEHHLVFYSIENQCLV